MLFHSAPENLQTIPLKDMWLTVLSISFTLLNNKELYSVSLLTLVFSSH